MNSYIAAAAVATFITALIHTFAGGREIAAPLLRQEGMNKAVKATLYFVWHVVTIVLLAWSIALWRLSVMSSDAATLAIYFSTFIAFAIGALSLVIGVKFTGRPWFLPQWIFFWIIAGLLLAGAINIGTNIV